MSQFVEKVFRSRQTLLEVLHDRGYDTVGTSKFGPEEIREALAATPNGKGLEFTVKAREGQIVPTPTVRVYIFLGRIKQKLPVELRDLNKYTDLTTLFTTIQPYREVKSEKEVSRGYDQEMHNQDIIVANNSKYKIVVPKTQEASCYFGRNTAGDEEYQVVTSQDGIKVYQKCSKI